MAKGRKKKRKKQRSPKQKAATRKLVARNRRKAKPRRRKAPKRRTKPKTRKKNKSTKPRKKSMAGRGGIRAKLNSPLLKKVLMAAGLASIATAVASLVLPGQAQLINSPVVKAGLGFAVGDIPGALTNFLLSGGVGGLSGGSNGGAVAQSTSGFA